MKKLIAFLATLFPLLALTPLAAQANLECSNGTCTQTFYYVGAPEEFVVPEAVTSLNFEVRAASGSRGGGGGIIRGTMVNPPSSFFVVVGQAGSMGINRAGGFNGGGSSGASRGTEGSGGGASDIRFGTDLASRVVVAGAGGGGGAGGVLGGAGGQLLAAAGSSGEGVGGGGGSQVSGGAAGINSSDLAYSTAGSFGQGGSGASGTAGGGGGGGGGWYGGGGGGGSFSLGTGGGGGGGSSYAMPDVTRNVSHEVGANFGHGRILISYQQPAEVVSFSANQLSRSQIKFVIGMSQNVQGFSSDDVTFSDATCSIWRTAITGTFAEVTLDSCQSPEVTLTLKARSIGTSTAGPIEAASFTASIDRAGPNFSWEQLPDLISSTSLVAQFALSDGITPASSSFEVVGCELEIQDRFAILTNCQEGVNTVTLPQNSFEDTWGNSGPSESKVLSFTVDTTPPTASWSPIIVSGSGPFSYSTTLTFSEAVVLTITAVSFSSSVDCQHGNDGFTFWASCDYGRVQWSLNLDEVSDLAGNSTSASVVVDIEHRRPVVAPQPDPQPVQVIEPSPIVAPADPAPTATPVVTEPTVTEPVVVEVVPTESPVVPEVVTESEVTEPLTGSDEIEMIPEQFQGGMVVTELPPRPQVLVAATSEPRVIETVESQPTVSTVASQEKGEPDSSGNEQVELVAGPAIELADEPQPPWLLISAGVIALLMGIGFWRFSGR